MSMSRVQRVLNILKTPLRSYNEVAQRYPFETGVVTTVVKTSAADLFAQKVRWGPGGVHGLAAALQLGTAWLHINPSSAWLADPS